MREVGLDRRLSARSRSRSESAGRSTACACAATRRAAAVLRPEMLCAAVREAGVAASRLTAAEGAARGSTA